MKRKTLVLAVMLTAIATNNALATPKKKKTKAHHSKQHHTTTYKAKRKPANNYMEGIASFYGDNDGFDGRTMANGDTFDAEDVYASAHPTLPLGTKLMVTNLANGRSICVEVKDRMPRQGRVIDLSTAAAMYLGMHKRGLTRVKLVKITDDEFEEKKRYLIVNDDDTGKPG